jgi:hypothetical protein
MIRSGKPGSHKKLTAKDAAVRIISDALLVAEEYWQDKDNSYHLEMENLTEKEKIEIQKQLTKEVNRFFKKYEKRIWDEI